MNEWNLKKLYESEDAFLADLEKFKSLTPKLAAYKGKLADEKSFVEFLKLTLEAETFLEKLHLFAHMRSDRDKKNVENASDLKKVMLAYEDFAAQMSWQDPEVLAIGEEKVDGFFKRNPKIAQFDFAFKKLFKDQGHVLSSDKEALLSNYSPILDEAGTLYSMLAVADSQIKKAVLSDGTEVEVSQANWTSLVREAKREKDREIIFKTLYTAYDTNKNTYAEIYNLGLQSQLASMKSRGYKSILATHLEHNNIPESVFHNLIEVASNGSTPLKRYYEIRRKYLGLEKHRSYDRFLQLAKSDKKYTFDEAKELFWDSIKEFPKDFQDKAHEVLADGYVDVYPSLGKRSGAYSTGGFGIHPFILLNYVGDLNDVFTTAHESGHSIHTMYSEEAQPLEKQGYTIFVAEIASTFNEHNLLDYLIKSGKLNKNDKIYLLQKAIDEIASTFYRQTLFAQYEYEVSVMAERGTPINYQVLSDEMTKLYKTYYGIDISEEEVKPLVWAYIPHLFYTPFYVYQYATSFTASMLLYENVKNGVEGAFEKHINLLKSGGSNYPIEQVKAAGVDLTTKEPFMAVVRRMETLVNELEELLK